MHSSISDEQSELLRWGHNRHPSIEYVTECRKDSGILQELKSSNYQTRQGMLLPRSDLRCITATGKHLLLNRTLKTKLHNLLPCNIPPTRAILVLTARGYAENAS